MLLLIVRLFTIQMHFLPLCQKRLKPENKTDIPLAMCRYCLCEHAVGGHTYVGKPDSRNYRG